MTATTTVLAETTTSPTEVPTATTLSIAEVAEKVGLTAHTLRYYERIGLLDVARDAGGRRRYADHDLGRILFITKLRAADLPISQIQHYFALVAAGPHTEPQRLALLEAHRDEVKTRLASLQNALAAIEFKIAVYGGSAEACTPIPVPVPVQGDS